MKKIILVLATVMFMVSFTSSLFGQICTPGISHTTCFPYLSGDGVLSNGKNNDTPRLNRAITATLGKLIFNESEYFLGESTTDPNLKKTLTVFSYRILEGTGRSPGVGFQHNSSKIIQTKADEAIFTIGKRVTDVSIRDLALVGAASGTIGILATSDCLTEVINGETVSCTSVGFQFSNLHFTNFKKGIWVNAKDPRTIANAPSSAHQWQFDNVQLNHALFENCTIGIHLNSFNSGWNISSIQFLSPIGAEQGAFIPRPANDPPENDNNRPYP